MALGFGEILSPSVKAMAAKQEAVNGGIALQQRLDFLCQLRDVLRIFEDGKDFAMRMRVDVAKAFEHLEPFERHGAFGGENIGKQRAPQRMRMQDRASPASAHDGKMERRLRRGQSVPANYARRFINFQKLLRVERALIQSRCSDRQAQRPRAHHRAEISARSKHPAALVETSSDLRKGSSQILKAAARFIPVGASSRFARFAFPGANHGPDYRTLGPTTEFWQRRAPASGVSSK